MSDRKWGKGTSKSGQITRTLPPDTEVPPGTPRRVPTSDGYWELRWKVAPYEYVRALEHRVRDGRTLPAHTEVHHIDRNRQNNSPENLHLTTHDDHPHEHRSLDWVEIVRLYQTGMSMSQVGEVVGTTKSGVRYALRMSGVPTRRGVNQWNGRR